MIFRYRLPSEWVAKISNMLEFASGGTKVTVRTKDGKTFHDVLISNCMWPVAVKGFEDLPFKIEEIQDIFQTEDDKNPQGSIHWHYWDDWGKK